MGKHNRKTNNSAKENMQLRVHTYIYYILNTAKLLISKSSTTVAVVEDKGQVTRPNILYKRRPLHHSLH